MFPVTILDRAACGSPITLELGPERPLSRSLTDALVAADEDERVEISRDCWGCGWQETRQICVESIDTTAGERTAIERATFVDEITDELSAIDHVATLEEFLAEVRRQRQTNAVRGAADEDSPDE